MLISSLSHQRYHTKCLSFSLYARQHTWRFHKLCFFFKKERFFISDWLVSFGSWASECYCSYPDCAIDLSPTAVLKIALNTLPASLRHAVEQMIALINKRNKSHPLINRLFCWVFLWTDSGRGARSATILYGSEKKIIVSVLKPFRNYVFFKMTKWFSAA